MFGFLKRKNVKAMWLLVGLGNPGDEHARNRHNIGFMVIDEVASQYGFSSFRSKFQGHLSEGRIGGEKVALLKPQTYMNDSGQSIKAAAKFFKVVPDRILIFHDELDLAPGKIRIKKGGGVAGHNGLRSAKNHLGTADFWRARMGIGHPGDKNRVSGYVLKDFSKVEQLWVETLVRASSDRIELMLDGHDGEYMSKVAMDSPAPAEQKKKKEAG